MTALSPISGILCADVLQWQEFSWSSKTCAFEDLLQMLVGERLAVRVPCARPVHHRNPAPMFYTAWAPLGMTGADAMRVCNLNMAMAERFTTRTWSRPLPHDGRIPQFPQCACCFSKFILEHGRACAGTTTNAIGPEPVVPPSGRDPAARPAATTAGLCFFF